MNSDISRRTIACSSSNKKFGERAAEFGFTDAGRAEKNERADRPVLILQAGARAAHRIGHGVNRAVLADDAELEAIFHLEQFLDLAFEHLRDRDAGPFGDHFGDVFGVDLFFEHLLIFLQLGELSVRSSKSFCSWSACRSAARRRGSNHLRVAPFALRLWSIRAFP
jgi:hypothetical protein